VDQRRAQVDPDQTVHLGPEWQPASFALLVARGHDLSIPILKLDSLGQGVIRVGRDADNDLVIEHPAVSRHHAEIMREGQRYVVHDLDSDNGSFVCYAGDPAQERRLAPGGENALKNHSIVRFGPANFTLLLYP